MSFFDKINNYLIVNAIKTTAGAMGQTSPDRFIRFCRLTRQTNAPVPDHARVRHLQQ